jgi:hypothetical protein
LFCIPVSGSFVVKQLEFGPANEVLSFWATFEKHCPSDDIRWEGEARWNADVPISIAAPSELTITVGETVAFNVVAVATNRQPVMLSATRLPPGASLLPVGNNVAAFNWVTDARHAGVHHIVFVGTNSAGDTEKVFTRVFAKAVVPPNDQPAGATLISQLPFIDALNTSEASNTGEPQFCVGKERTVWYAYTPPANMTLEASTMGSDFPAAVTVFAGGVSDTNYVTCGPQFVRFRASGGTTYYFQTGIPIFLHGSNLVFSLAQSVTEIPANDELTNATTIASLPFTEQVNTSVATVYLDIFCRGTSRTVWYRYTPAADVTLEATTAGSDFRGTVSVYVGTPKTLTSLSCGPERVRFRALAGQTYYFQAGTESSETGSNLVFSIFETVDVASFGISKAQLYLQRSAESRGTFFAALFRGWTFATTEDDVYFARLHPPNGREEIFPSTRPEYLISHRFARRGALERKYGSGNYSFTIGAVHDGTNEFILNVPESDYPNAPHVSNWRAAQAIAADRSFTFTWDALHLLQPNDQIDVEILDESRSRSIFRSPPSGSPDRVWLSATSFTIPAGTLASDTKYFGVISFTRQPLIDRNVYPRAFGISAFGSVIGFPMRTIGSTGAGAGTLRLTSRRYFVAESSEVAAITVLRTGGRAGVVTVDFSTADDTAIAGEDYISVAGTLTFEEGETSKVITVPILGGSEGETTETFKLVLTKPTADARLGLSRTTISIAE